jgi:dihydrofolate reductase
MSKVTTGFSMSLDGFIAGPDDDIQRLFAWMFIGSKDVELSGGDANFSLKVSPQTAEMLEGTQQTSGALVAGRRLFEVAGAWGGKHPMDVPVIVVTHHPAQEWMKEGSPFTFITDGIESAIDTAREIAGDKNVIVASASIVQQCLNLGLLDEIHVDVVPVLLGEGIRLFDHLETAPIELERTRVIEAPGVTHMTYRVIK